MKTNEIQEIHLLTLYQLARAVVGGTKDTAEAYAALCEAYAWVFRLEEESGQLSSLGVRTSTESLQTALIALRNASLNLSVAIALILEPAFLSGLISHVEIEKEFGNETACILQELKLLKSLHIEKNSIQNYPAQLDISSPSILAILMQVCDILRIFYNGEIVENQKVENALFNDRLLFELKYFYIPLTHRMCLYDIQTKLTDFWFRHEDTFNYDVISAQLGMSRQQREKRLSLIAEEVKSVIKRHGIKFFIRKRVKSVYSIWNKIQELKVDFGQIYDISAMRIIIMDMDNKTLVEERIACWKVLTIISELYKPLYNVMRDWISTPRESGYESLHLTFETPKHGKLEVQVRTERMDYIAEYGTAAHWKYKRTH